MPWVCLCLGRKQYLSVELLVRSQQHIEGSCDTSSVISILYLVHRLKLRSLQSSNLETEEVDFKVSKENIGNSYSMSIVLLYKY